VPSYTSWCDRETVRKGVYPSAEEVSYCEPSLARAAGARSPATAVATIVVLDGSSERQVKVRDFRDYSGPERQSLVAKPLVYVDALRANPRLSWSTDFSKRSEKRTGGRMRIPIHDASSYSTRICLRTN